MFSIFSPLENFHYVHKEIIILTFCDYLELFGYSVLDVFGFSEYSGYAYSDTVSKGMIYILRKLEFFHNITSLSSTVFLHILMAMSHLAS